uniref:2-oxoglutarate dehydrogenase, mitochondrial n=1 Tax=Blastobotrys adeninivorans TaxID=409370 RepID=A0A060SXT5_BLAAD
MLRAASRNSGLSRALRRSRISPRAALCNPAQLTIRHYSLANDVFLSSTNASYIDEMYHAWKQDPASVHVSWQAYFGNMESGSSAVNAFRPPPTIVPGSSGAASPSAGLTGDSLMDHLKVQLLVRAYQARGHTKAKLDPLGISFGDSQEALPKELTIEHYGWTEKDLDKEISLGPGILPQFTNGKSKMALRDVINACERTYCGSYGVEYVHIADREKCDWLREQIEVPKPFNYSMEERRQILDRVTWSVLFETFMATKFPNDKRFGLEGAEGMIPGMKSLIDCSVENGVEDIVIGMAHRGRLNMLANVIRKPSESIFAEFVGNTKLEVGSGDVKYHLGANFTRPTTSGKPVNLSLVANPSHLEAEDPVVLGQVRAIQHFKGDEGTGEKAMAVLLHGDAAFAAQGVVYETIGFHQLPKYSTGGTIHVIVNNQIGFTTDPRFGRSTAYPSDLAKAMDAPIFHVNAEDVEAVNFIFSLAAQWRARYKSDVIVDIVGYRKHGHNEVDQPQFTQPLMYQRIAEKDTVLDIYADKLLREGTFTKQEIEDHKKWVWETLEDALGKARDYKKDPKEWQTAAWEGFKTLKDLQTEILPHLPTAVETNKLKHYGTVLSSYPEGFTLHRSLKRILNTRQEAINSGENIDWSTGEALAFASLVDEGFHVRISGQDVERGTFSHRHAVLHDQQTEEVYTPLEHISENQGKFVASNSSLSEYGVMGFEYGYSVFSPQALVVWEAQFGDFANTGQVIIDCFFTGGEFKWMQRSGLVLSLPHGYDGQGPEHSTGRLERFLQMTNEDPLQWPTEEHLSRQHQDCNFQVAFPSTPANLFHLLRRQMHRPFRKPLALFFSKSLLRHPLTRSSLDEFTGESGFQRVIEDPEHGKAIGTKKETKRLILCSGQVWAHLHKGREENGIKDTALVRLEQYHPFPFEILRDLLNSYPNLEELVFCQEEPVNYGAWSWVNVRLGHVLNKTEKYAHLPIRFAGRRVGAAPASGSKAVNDEEAAQVVRDALQL